LATIETSHVKALKFEITRDNGNPSSSMQQSVSGYVSIEGTDHESSEILQKLSSAGIVEKFNLVYQNYAFRLIGASFKASSEDNAKQEVTYAFNAKDVMLVREAFGS
jgi:hypothetical protein